MKKIKKVVLAYSGGLDTSVLIKWIKDKYDCEVVAYSSNVGQEQTIAPLIKRAKAAGASKVIIEDLKEMFAKDYIMPALKAHAMYEGQYPLATALSRPLIVDRLVKAAKKEKADAVAHGCTGKGNDQVRFEAGVFALAPELMCLAPVREWEFASREAEIEYAKKHKIPIDVTKKKVYSIDKNIWGVSVECGELEDPWTEPSLQTYIMTSTPEKAPNKPCYVEVSFEKGVPKKINGKTYGSLVKLIEELNAIGGKHGIGRADIVENRLVGIKSREIYEFPAGEILIKAHKDLESLVLDRETLHYKEILGHKYSELIYNGLWFSPLKEYLDAFMQGAQKYVTGAVKLKLYKGNCRVVGRKSKYSLYSEDLATYTEEDKFDQSLSKGFIELWSLPLKVTALKRKKK
ncbi:MAG: argininosuccinate synthase [Elusimicrobiota bacterium]